jgi:hypothetical protein
MDRTQFASRGVGKTCDSVMHRSVQQLALVWEPTWGIALLPFFSGSLTA